MSKLRYKSKSDRNLKIASKMEFVMQTAAPFVWEPLQVGVGIETASRAQLSHTFRAIEAREDDLIVVRPGAPHAYAEIAFYVLKLGRPVRVQENGVENLVSPDRIIRAIENTPHRLTKEAFERAGFGEHFTEQPYRS